MAEVCLFITQLIIAESSELPTDFMLGLSLISGGAKVILLYERTGGLLPVTNKTWRTDENFIIL